MESDGVPSRTQFIADALSLIGAVLIFINVLAIAFNGSSITISPYSVSSVGELLKSGGSLWYRISFGVPSFVEGPPIIVWIIVSIVNLFLATFLYLSPERHAMSSFFILMFSLCSFLAGGGFIIGSLLGVIGSGIGLQWREKLGETFLGKLIRVIRLDSAVFASIKKNPKLIREAAVTIMFINFLSGLGCSLYIFNVDKILNSTPDISAKILLLGETFFSLSTLGLPLMYMGLSIIKWILLALIIYLIGSKLLGEERNFDTIAGLIAFAYAPVSLQVFLPFVFLNQPFLTVHWPLSVFLATNFWMILALIVAVKQLFEATTTKAIGIVMLSGSIYWPLTYKFMLPIFFTSDSIPGIFFDVGPNDFILMLISLSALLSFMLGTFTKH